MWGLSAIIGLYEVINVQEATVKQAVSAARKRISAAESSGIMNISTAVLCFLISRAEMFSAATPLGISFLAAAYKKGFWGIVYTAACILGLLTSHSGFVYVPSAVILFLIAYFEQQSGGRSKMTTALYACGAVLIAGLPAVLWLGGYALDMLRLLISSFGAFLGVYAFSAALGAAKQKGRHCLSNEELLSLAATVCLAALGLQFGKIGYVTPLNVLCAFAVLAVSGAGSAGAGAAAGVVCGFVMGCGNENVLIVMGVMGMCGLAAGLFGTFGKAGSAVGFILCVTANACIAESVDKISLPAIDAAISVLMFFAVPKRVMNRIGIYNRSAKDEETASAMMSVSDRLSCLSGAFFQMSDSIKFFGSGRGKARTSRFDMFDKAADSVCRDCKNCTLCWQKYYNDTYDITMKCFHEVDKSGAVAKDFLPDFFKERCLDADGFIRSINRTYEEFKDELLWQGRLSKASEMSAERFSDAAGAVDKLCSELKENASFNAELARGAASALEREGIPVKTVSVFKNPYGRYEVKLKLSGCGGRDVCKRCGPIISEILECGMEKSAGECMIGECSVIFTEASLYSVSHSIVGCAAAGEDVSGDSAVCFSLPDGNELVLLCDGKGVGGEANLVSSEMVRLISKLMSAGFESSAAVRLANSAMAVRADDEQFSTVDMAVINTVNGSCVFVKNGSCPTFVVSGEKIERITCDNLPVGVGTEMEVTEKYCKFESGDEIIMMSDGVYDAFSSEKQLKSEISDIIEKEAPEPAAKLLKAAKKRIKTEGDDMTVVYAKIVKK